MSAVQIAAAALPSISATASAVSSVATGPVSDVATAVGSFINTTVPSIVASLLPPGATTESAASLVVPIKLVAPQYEIAATFVGAVSGSLIAVRKRFDIMGVLTIAIVNGLGGGIIRDVLLQKYGIAAFEHQYLLWTALVAGLIGFFFAELIRRGRLAFMLVDSLSLGLFAIIGSDKALAGQLGIVPVILLGVITATGGGILRDVLTGEVPQALQPGSMYAFAATVGTSAFVLMLVWLGLVKPVAAFIAVAIILGLRLLSIFLGWQTPTPVDLTPWIARAVPVSVRQAAGRLGQSLPDLPDDPRKPLPPMMGRRARARKAGPPDEPGGPGVPGAKTPTTDGVDDGPSDSQAPGSGKD